MKKIKTSAVILLTALFSANVVLASEGELPFTFNLSNKDQPDANNPYFNCDVTDKAPISLGSISPTKVTFTIIGDALAFGEKGKEMKDVSVIDIKNKYFKVTKGATQGEGKIHFSINNDSVLTCYKGQGTNKTLYND